MFNKIRQFGLFLILLAVSILFAYCLPPRGDGNLNPFQQLYLSSKEGDKDNSENSNKEKEEDPDERDPDEKDSDDDSDDDDSDDEPSIDEEQIPYNMKLDTMALLGCENTRVDFTFKMGAFGSGGIKIKKVLSNKSIAELKKYPYHQADPFITLASLSDPDNVRIDSSNVLRGASFHNRLSRLQTHLKTLKTAVDEDPDNYLTELSGYPLSVEYKLSIAIQERYFDQRDLLVGFRKGRTPLTYFNEETQERYIHGRYYTIVIDDLTDNSYVLENIEEFNPRADSTKNWDCPEVYQYHIKRHSDRTADGESECEDSAGDDQASYNLIKRVLKEKSRDRDKWNINVSEKCISPKSSIMRCYPNGVTKVSYDLDDCSRLPNKFCPHYFSICLRDFAD